MQTGCSAAEAATAGRFEALVKAARAERGAQEENLRAVRFTGQVAQLGFAVDCANATVAGSGLRQAIEAFVQAVAQAVDGGDGVDGGVGGFECAAELPHHGAQNLEEKAD